MIKLDVELIIEDMEYKCCYSENGKRCRFMVPVTGCGGITFGYKCIIFQKKLDNKVTRLVECVNCEIKIGGKA